MTRWLVFVIARKALVFRGAHLQIYNMESCFKDSIAKVLIMQDYRLLRSFHSLAMTENQSIATASLREVGTTSWQSMILSINKDSIAKVLIMQDYRLLRRCLTTKKVM